MKIVVPVSFHNCALLSLLQRVVYIWLFCIHSCLHFCMPSSFLCVRDVSLLVNHGFFSAIECHCFGGDAHFLAELDVWRHSIREFVEGVTSCTEYVPISAFETPTKRFNGIYGPRPDRFGCFLNGFKLLSVLRNEEQHSMVRPPQWSPRKWPVSIWNWDVAVIQCFVFSAVASDLLLVVWEFGRQVCVIEIT